MRGVKTHSARSTQASLRSKAASMLEPGLASKPADRTGNPAPMSVNKKIPPVAQAAMAEQMPVGMKGGGKMGMKGKAIAALARALPAAMAPVPTSPAPNPIAARQAVNPRMLGATPQGFKKGGKVAKHDDTAEDTKLFNRLYAEKEAKEPKGMKKGGKFIAGAIKKPGELHRDLGVPQGEKIPAKKLEAAASRPGKVGQRARFAETLKGMHKAEGGKVCMAEGGVAKLRKKVMNPDGSPKANAVPRNKLGRH